MELDEAAAVAEELHDFCARFHPLFGHDGPRATFEGVLRGLSLPSTERKNGWYLAHAAGHATPHVLHSFLTRTLWCADAVVRTHQAFLLEQLGAHGALIFDDTGFLKKGTASVGVARQYTGTAGAVENCQIGVFAAFVTPHAHVLWDRRLFLPKAWAQDAPRCRDAHVPEGRGHQTKHALAAQMLEAALEAGMRPAWVGGDSAYGRCTRLRELAAARVGAYVFEVECKTQVWTAWPEVERACDAPSGPPGAFARQTVEALAAQAEASAWARHSMGAGAKGERVEHWLALEVVEAQRLPSSRDLPARASVLLVRAHEDPKKRAYFLCHSAQARTTQEWVERIGTRWPIEQCFEEAKGEFGLDAYEVRRWEGWHRHVTLSMVAHGFMACARARALARADAKKKSAGGRPAPRGGAG